MTAYSRVQKKNPSGTWTVELHSVNRKGLDFRFEIPHNLLSLELDVRKWLSEEIFRGQVTVRIGYQPKEDLALVSQLKPLMEKWEKIARDIGLDPREEVNLRFLLDQLDQSSTSIPDKTISAELKKVITETLSQFVEMRKREGAELLKDLLAQLETVTRALKKIQKRAPLLPDAYREKLQQKMAEIAPNLEEERIIKEVALFAERIDVHEEIVRLGSHIKQFTDLLKAKQAEGVGRTLDFIAQEMNREIQTLSSKTSDIEVGKLALHIKASIEKIREQVQNIE